MEKTKGFISITVVVSVNAKIDMVWEFWNNPEHIKKWYHASDDWHAPAATNDLRPGGKFNIRMESVDGKMGFDFEGVYETVAPQKLIEYSLADGRKVKIEFIEQGAAVEVRETFDLENENPEELQRNGWQAILNNFKGYVESANTKIPLSFDISIDAPANVVYKKLIGEDSFKEWTKIFNKDSHFIGTWDKGAKILFIGTDDKGNRGGMVSFIEENIPDKYISIEHRGIVSGDKEIMNGHEVDFWAGAYERYTLTNQNGSTTLNACIDSNEVFKEYFTETFPKALDVLKKLCESN